METATYEIDNLMKWVDLKWKKYDGLGRQIFLKITRDEVMIISNNKVVELFNAFGPKKGFYKDNIFILVAKNTEPSVIKIRFKIMNNREKCVESLGKWFPVVNRSGEQINCLDKYRDVHDVLADAVKNRRVSNSIEELKGVKEFTKLCLLDPAFLDVVTEVESTLKQMELLE